MCMNRYQLISVSILLLIAFSNHNSKAQIGTVATHASWGWNKTFGHIPKFGLDYQFKDRNILRLEGSYFVDKNIGYRDAHWSLGISHNYVMGRSKKFPGLTTWYTGQSLEYSQHSRDYNDKRLSHGRVLSMNLSIGRQFNLSNSFSLFSELGITQSIYSRIEYPNLPPFDPYNYKPGQRIESQIDESLGSFGSGFYFKTGLIYRFPIKK